MAEFQFPPLARDLGVPGDRLTEQYTDSASTLALKVVNARQRFPPPAENAGPAKLLLIAGGSLRFGVDDVDIALDPTNEVNEATEVDGGVHRTVVFRLRVDKQLGLQPLVGSGAFAGIGSTYLPTGTQFGRFDKAVGAATDNAGIKRDPTPDLSGFDAWYLSDVVAYGTIGDDDVGQLYRMGYQAFLLVETPIGAIKRETEKRISTTIS